MVTINKINRILNNEFISKLLDSAFGRISFIFFTLVFSFVCTQLYGAEVFGKYTYAFTLVSILMIFPKAGFDQGLIYSIPKYYNKHISLSFIVNIVLSFFVMLIVGIYIDDTFVRLMLPLVWLMSMEQIFFGIYRSENKIREYYFINGFLSMLLRVILVTVFYFFMGENVIGIIIGVYISFLFSNILYLYQNKKKFGKIIFDKEFLKYSFPLIFATIMATLIDKIDIIMLGNMATMEDVGIYQIALQVANTITISLFVFNTVFAPKIAKLFHEGKMIELRGIYKKSTRLLGMLALLFITIILLLGEPILFVFGNEITEGEIALIYRAIGQFVNVAVGSVWLMLAMTGEPKFQMYANVVALVLNVVLNYLLIPSYGMNGAAFASMTSIILINIIGYVIVSRRFKVKVYKFV